MDPSARTAVDTAARAVQSTQLAAPGRTDPWMPRRQAMTTSIDDLLPTAKNVMEKIALEEAKKASKEMQRRAAADAEKQALIDQLSKPSGVSDEEGIRRGAAIIQRAAARGLTEVQVHRFPNSMCTDRGRAINQQEPGWEAT